MRIYTDIDTDAYIYTDVYLSVLTLEYTNTLIYTDIDTDADIIYADEFQYVNKINKRKYIKEKNQCSTSLTFTGKK